MSQRCPEERIYRGGRFCLNHHGDVCPFPIGDEQYCLRYQERIRKMKFDFKNITGLDYKVQPAESVFDFGGEAE